MIKYFVSYRYYMPNQTGNGRTQIKRELPITDISEIKDIENVIQANSFDLNTLVVIQNWQRFEDLPQDKT